MRVALFITCFDDTLFPGTGSAVVSVLERLGHTVDFPEEQTCCGQMHFNTGYRRDAVPLVKRFAEVFGMYDAVVTPSASCAGMVREGHPVLAAEYGSPVLQHEVRELVPRVHEFTGFLTDVLGVVDAGAYFPHRVAYHPACDSLRGLRLGDRPLRLLRSVKGIDLAGLPEGESRHGFGGTFAARNADTSSAVPADRTDRTDTVRKSGAEVLCAADTSCLLHIGGGLSRRDSPVRAMHLAEILASTEGSLR